MSGRSEATVAAGNVARAGVIIAGASFAGLAAAREIGDAALLVDPVPVGSGQTSACAAPVGVLESLGAEASIQQRHDVLVLHLAGRVVRWPLPEPFCTFDYRGCCLQALSGAGSPVLRASVLNRRGRVVGTSAGDLEGRVLIDCTGWRAALALGGVRAAGAGPRTRPHALGGAKRCVAFGLEAEVEGAFPPGLHFYFGPEVAPDGYAWVFPAGRVSRIGVLSYRGRTRLRSGLDAFLSRLGIRAADAARALHGGFLRGDLWPAVVDDVFVAGDAAGQCLPFSGEGIRTAVWAGRACGRLARMVLEEQISMAEAQRRYRALVVRQRRRYRALVWATAGMLVLPPRALVLIASGLGRPGPLAFFMRRYLRVFSEYAAVSAA